MRKQHKIIALFALLLSFAAIQPSVAQKGLLEVVYNNGKPTMNFNTDSVIKIDFEYNTTIYNTLHVDTIWFTAAAGAAGIGLPMLHSGEPITIEEDYDWFDVELTRYTTDSTSTSFNYNYTVYASINDSDEDRYGSFKIKSGNKEIVQQVAQSRYVSSFSTSYLYGGEILREIDVNIPYNQKTYSIGILPGFGIELLSYPKKWLKAINCTNYCEGNTTPSKNGSYTSVTITTEDNLGTEPQTGIIVLEDKNGEQLIINLTKENIKASSITSLFYDFGKWLGESYHNDFGYPAMMLWSDSRGIDLVSEYIGYNWFTSALEYSDLKSTAVGTHIFWRTMYQQIEEANNLILTIGKTPQEKHLKQIVAQAYAIRAFDYFTLAQYYQHTYVGNEDALCVPIFTEANADSVNCPRATVREVYTQIKSDLDKAIELLKTTEPREDKRYADLAVAYGLRARVNLVMNNWMGAVNDAQNAIDNTTATPYTMNDISRPGFSDIEDKSWMWGCLVEETNRAVTSQICNFPSHMGSLNYGYASVGAWRYINQKLYHSIPDTDARKGWWLNENRESAHLDSKQRNCVQNYDIPAYTQMKFGCYKDELYTSTNANDIPLMRVEEMHLILAEALAMAGYPTIGATKLEEFVKTYRDPEYTCTATTKKDVQEAVWQQRRIELWGEGFSYTDLMRLKKNIDRRGAGFEPEYVFNIPAVEGEYGYNARIFQIPSTAMDKNALLVPNPEGESPMPVDDY